MKRFKYPVLLAILIIGAWLLAFPGVGSAASTLYIDITAQGSEVTITCNCTSWSVGTVHNNDNVATNLSYCNVTNTTSEAVEITAHGNEMKDAATGAAETWTLASTGTPGANAFAMFIGVNDTNDDWETTVREHDDGSFDKLDNDADTTLAASDYWNFGFDFLAPTSSTGNEAMIMCDDAGSETNDTDNGLTLIAAVP